MGRIACVNNMQTGVFPGYSLFGNTFLLVMSGIGIVALWGIVVRNGILLVAFMDMMLKEGMELLQNQPASNVYLLP